MKRNAVEWAVLGISVAGIVVLIGALIIAGLGGQRPADPTVELRMSEARQGAQGWIVPMTVRNAGEEAAEAVILEARAMVDGDSQTSQVEVDFLPAGTSVEAAFAFTAQPAGEVTVRLVSYRVP
jgi:uncharacterized protein (TIGR02588 family)